MIQIFLADGRDGRTDGPTEGSTRGPRGPNRSIVLLTNMEDEAKAEEVNCLQS